MIVKVQVSAQKVSGQFVTAFEGGSNYWLHAAALLKADVRPTEKPWYSCPVVFEKNFEIELRYDDPDGYEGEGRGLKVITQDDVVNGLTVMADKYPRLFADVVSEDGDAETADAFVQCVLFGKLVYG